MGEGTFGSAVTAKRPSLPVSADASSIRTVAAASGASFSPTTMPRHEVGGGPTTTSTSSERAESPSSISVAAPAASRRLATTIEYRPDGSLTHSNEPSAADVGLLENQ